MADEGIPWMIGGGVRHGVEVARLLAYVASGGSEGIIGPKDLQVRSLASPGLGVRMAPGAAAILNRDAGAAYDTYAARWPLEETLAISAPGSTARTDMIIARIENPYSAGSTWPKPADADLAAGTAVMRRFAVISNVPSTATTLADTSRAGDSAIPLARINLAAGATVINQADITDLRYLAQPKRDDQQAILVPGSTQTLSATGPSDITSSATTVLVPRWATHYQARAILAGVGYGTTGQTQGVAGNLRLALGSSTGPYTGYNVAADSKDRGTFMAASPLTALPSALRGTSQSLRVQYTKSSGSTSLSVDSSTTISIEVRFLQVPESN